MQLLELKADSSLGIYNSHSVQASVLVGGSPLRLVRLSRTGARIINSVLENRQPIWPPQPGESGAGLLRRLVRKSMLHPQGDPETGVKDLGFVIPVFNDVDAAERSIAAIRDGCPNALIVVVDDGNEPEVKTNLVNLAVRFGAITVSLEANLGPAAARNRGVAELEARGVEAVVFVDAGVEVEPNCVSILASHLIDPRVGVAAARVRARPPGEPTSLDVYEDCYSPLDLGIESALVRPGSRVAYVPAAALLVRRSVFVRVGGFDEQLRYGEDVDLVWRIERAGSDVRYEPAAIAWHRNRSGLLEFGAQRFGYASAAAALATRHGTSVAPVRLGWVSATAWAIVTFGPRRWRLAGVALFAQPTTSLARRIRRTVAQPWKIAGSVTFKAQRRLAMLVARALIRVWAPIFGFASLRWTRARRIWLVGFVWSSIVDWRRAGSHKRIGLARFMAWRLVDDLSYCAGLWSGCWIHKSATALTPLFAAPWGSAGDLDENRKDSSHCQ